MLLGSHNHIGSRTPEDLDIMGIAGIITVTEAVEIIRSLSGEERKRVVANSLQRGCDRCLLSECKKVFKR